MQNDFRTVAFYESADDEMMDFLDRYWDRVIDVFFRPEYQHPGSEGAYVVKIKPNEKHKPSIRDILPK